MSGVTHDNDDVTQNPAKTVCTRAMQSSLKQSFDTVQSRLGSRTHAKLLDVTVELRTSTRQSDFYRDINNLCCAAAKSFLTCGIAHIGGPELFRSG